MDSPTAFSLAQELKENAERVHAFLQEYYDKKVATAAEYDEVSKETMEIIRSFILLPGKYVRSYIASLAYQLAGGKDLEAFTAIGAAIEINHYTLLSIDDVADRDTTRHGGPTVEVMYKQLHKQIPVDQQAHYARSFTEIANTLMYSHVFELLTQSSFTAEQIRRVIPIFLGKMLDAPAIGWSIHLLQNHEPLSAVSEQRFVKGLTFVTAVYTFVGPAFIGLELAGADAATTAAIKMYGLKVGTGFQIHDDILGLFGDPKITGKSAGNDVREGKKTLLLQNAYKHAKADDKAFLDRVVGTNLSEEDLERVREIVKSTGSLEYSKNRAKFAVAQGLEALEGLQHEKNAQYIEKLKQLAEFVITREK